MSLPPFRHLFNPAKYCWVKAINYITVHFVTFSPPFPLSFFSSNFFLQLFGPLSGHDVPCFFPRSLPRPVRQYSLLNNLATSDSISPSRLFLGFSAGLLSPNLPPRIRFQILFPNTFGSNAPSVSAYLTYFICKTLKCL